MNANTMTLRTPEALLAAMRQFMRAPLTDKPPDLDGLTPLDLLNCASMLAGLFVGALDSFAADLGAENALEAIDLVLAGADLDGLHTLLTSMADQADAGNVR